MKLKKQELAFAIINGCFLLASLILAVWSKGFFMAAVLFALSCWSFIEYQRALLPNKPVSLVRSNFRSLKNFFQDVLSLETYKRLVWLLCGIFFVLGVFVLFIDILALALGWA